MFLVLLRAVPQGSHSQLGPVSGCWGDMSAELTIACWEQAYAGSKLELEEMRVHRKMSTGPLKSCWLPATSCLDQMLWRGWKGLECPPDAVQKHTKDPLVKDGSSQVPQAGQGDLISAAKVLVHNCRSFLVEIWNCPTNTEGMEVEERGGALQCSRWQFSKTREFTSKACLRWPQNK